MSLWLNADVREMCRLLLDQTFRYRAENSLPSDPILNGMKAVNIVVLFLSDWAYCYDVRRPAVCT
jgi:hypothetical protein